jgi:hypothetical protein
LRGFCELKMTETASTKVAADETHVLIIGAGTFELLPFPSCN